MLMEIGTVINTKNRTASISIPREEKCSGCKHCLRDQTGTNMLTFAENSIGAHPGDMVVIESQNIDKVKDGFKLFILPLILFPFGFIAGNLSGSVIIALITGFILSAIPFVFFKLNTKKH